MAAAYKVIGQLPLPADRVVAIRAAIDHAFLDGLRVGSLVCAGVAMAAAVVAAVLLPARERQTTPNSAPEPEPVDA